MENYYQKISTPPQVQIPRNHSPVHASSQQVQVVSRLEEGQSSGGQPQSNIEYRFQDDSPEINSKNQIPPNEQYYINCLGRKGTVIYRAIWLLVLAGFWVAKMMITSNPIWRFFSYLTNLSYTFSLIYLVLGMIYPLVKNPSPKFYNFFKKLFIVVYTSEFTVTVFYWPMVAKEDFESFSQCKSAEICKAYAIIAHGVILIPTFFSLFLEYTTVNWKDTGYLWVYNMIYVVILSVVTVYDKPLYGVIDLKGFISFVYIGGVIFLSFICLTIGKCISNCCSRSYKGPQK